MSTSLAEQLKRLQVPQTDRLTQDKKKASLLFNPKEASGLKRETVYQIGLDGFEELLAKSPSFEQFRSSLFDISSKKFERSMQDAESNKRLNKIIRKFLLLLSPYFPMSCSHKALEWLINRYSIHQYNRDDLLMLILPYHESNIFVRVLQLMKFKDRNDSWYFLKTLQKKGLHLTKHQLLSHAAGEVQFLKFVSKFISSLTKEHEKPSTLTVAFNYYCAVFVGAIEYSSNVSEPQITQMLPAIVKGLSSDIPDYCAASYVIVSRLVAKATLSDAILDKFVERISEINVETLQTEAVLILMLIYQSQKHYCELPEVALVNLAGKPWLPKVLQELNGSGCFIWSFLDALCKSAFKIAENEEYESIWTFVENLINAITFDPDFVTTFVWTFLSAFKSIKPFPEHLKRWLSTITETLDRQYPELFDKEVMKILSSEGKPGKQRKCLQRILKESVQLSGKFNVISKIYHPNPALRTEAMAFISENFHSMDDTTQEMVRNVILDRLNDNQIELVQSTLRFINENMLVNADLLKPVLLSLVNKFQKDLETWEPATKDAVLLLCKISEPSDIHTFLVIFPFLLPDSEEQLATAKHIINDKFIKKHSLIKLSKSPPNSEERFCDYIFEALKNKQVSLVEDYLEALKSIPEDQKDSLHKYMSTLVLSCILPEHSSIEFNASVVNLLWTYLESSEELNTTITGVFKEHLNNARLGEFPLEAYLLCVKTIISKTSKPKSDLGLQDFSGSDSFALFFTTLANNFFHKVHTFKKYAQFFLNYFAPSVKKQIEFLLNLMCSGNKSLGNQFGTQCLIQISALLEQVQDIDGFTNIDSVLVPYLLTVLSNEDENLRRKAFEIVESLSSIKESNSYVALLKKLLTQREEVQLDENQLPSVFANAAKASDKKALLKIATDDKYPIYLQAQLLKLLSYCNSIEFFDQTSPKATEILEQSENLDPIRSLIVLCNILRCDENIAAHIKLDSGVWKFIETTLNRFNTKLVVPGETKFATVLLINQLDKAFLNHVKPEVLSRILDLMIESSTFAPNPEVQPAVGHVFKHLDLDALLIIDHFHKMRDVQSPKLDSAKLKRRISVVPTIDILETKDWKKGVTTLEFIQDKKKIRNMSSLLSVLFEVLKKCLDFDEQAAVEYPKQLLLSSILHCCGKLEIETLSENIFNVELIVQCIRASQNPQTHHHALLVLAYGAQLVPSQVLHHVMAIFTFMGSSVLRHDDAYSCQIISKIIDTIVPILVKDDSSKTVPEVLRVFVDALLDVPEHRRVPLYKQLLTNIGIQAHLHVFLLRVFESHVLHSVREKKGGTMKRLDIAASICRQFNPDQVLNGSIELIKYLKNLPDEMEPDSEDTLFDIHHSSPKQFRHFKYTLLTFITNLLASGEFVSQVAALAQEEALAMEELYKNLLIEMLTYIQRTSKVAEKNASTPQHQYWKVILHHSYDIMDSVNSLLTSQMFLLVIKGLMLHSLSTVRRRALELLNARLQHNPTFFNDSKSEDIFALVPTVISIIKTINQENLESDQELIVQTALLSLKLLAKLLGQEYPDQFVEILGYVTDLLKCGKAKGNVTASLVLCLAELCASLRARAIAGLPNFMPAILKILKHQKHRDMSNLLLLSSLTAVQRVLEILPMFLSPYLEKMVYEVSLLTSIWGKDSTEQTLQPIVNKLANVREKIGSTIPPRVLIPIVQESYGNLIEKEAFDAIEPMMDILAENLNHLKPVEITSNLPELENFFLNALQFRAEGKASFEKANKVEQHIVKALTKFTMKLSESNFRPLFHKLFRWAAEVKSERLITFYALSTEISTNLKGLFVLFAGDFLKNATELLDACNTIKNDNLYFDDEDKTQLLLEFVLKTLNTTFTYSNSKFLNKERFAVIMQPLVDQLENNLGGVEGLEKRSKALVTPTLVQFAVAVADDALWKQLNYQVLLKMRHSSSNIRLIALECLTETVKKLGEDFLPLLPETIPFLSELLEDEEETVEKACRKSVQEMEKVLGENLMKYF